MKSSTQRQSKSASKATNKWVIDRKNTEKNRNDYKQKNKMK